MKATRPVGQIVLGVGFGLLLGGATSLFRHAMQAAAVAFVLAALCIGAGLYLMQHGGR